MKILKITVEMIDKVVFYKGRVWTVYSVSPDHKGVFAYQGLKPWPTYEHNGPNKLTKISTYIPSNEIKVIEGKEIDEYMSLEKKAEKRKLNKKYAVEFFSYLTGHTKSFISKNIKETFGGFEFTPGRISYRIWKMNGALYLSHNTNSSTTHAYFDYVTWEDHSVLYEQSERELEKEIVERYKDSIIAEYEKEKGVPR